MRDILTIFALLVALYATSEIIYARQLNNDLGVQNESYQYEIGKLRDRVNRLTLVKEDICNGN